LLEDMRREDIDWLIRQVEGDRHDAVRIERGSKGRCHSDVALRPLSRRERVRVRAGVDEAVSFAGPHPYPLPAGEGVVISSSRATPRLNVFSQTTRGSTKFNR